MASLHRPLFFLLLSSSFFLPFFTTSATQKVPLALYYEALCPFCSRFIVLSLSKIFSDGLISIVDLRLVPYGNALIGPNSTISCQQQHFSFIYCVENLVLTDKYSDWESCFQKTGLDPHPLVNCYSSGHGQEVELQYAAQTNALQPPLRYVPWVVVNGLPLYDDYDNYETYVCKSFHGELPGACRRPRLYIDQQMKTNRADRRCVKNDTASSLATNKHAVKISALI